MVEETLVWQDVLPEATCQAVEADAPALAECPNYWVPREVVEGRAPAITAAEQAVQQLYARLVAPQLAGRSEWLGAEYWCQIYEGGRGLGFHFDKDEHAMKEEGAMVNPMLSSVFYASGARDDALRQAPTVLIDQWFNHAEGCVEPDSPAWSSLVFPARNQYCLFGGSQAHGVLEGAPAELGAAERPRRVAFLVNWWAHQPRAIARASLEDVQQGRLAPICDALASSSGEGGGGGEDEALQPRRVQFVSLEAPAMQEGDVLPVDELLAQRGVRISGPGAADAVTIHHPGLALCPLDEASVDPAHPLQVLAALVPQEESESEEESSSEEEA